jgi:hypothetical protein
MIESLMLSPFNLALRAMGVKITPHGGLSLANVDLVAQKTARHFRVSSMCLVGCDMNARRGGKLRMKRGA